MTEDGRKRFPWPWRKRGQEPPQEINAVVEPPTITFPLGGIEKKQVDVDGSSSYPFIIIGLTDMEQFSEETFGGMFDQGYEWQSKQGDGIYHNQKYIVLSQENNGINTDCLFVFPMTIRHKGFLSVLQSLGYRGELQSAGYLHKDLRFTDYATSLLDDGLSRGKSDRYQQDVLTRKFRKS